MFLKPFKVKSSNTIRGSDRKRLKDAIRGSFASLSDDDVAALLQDKDNISSTRILTSKESVVTVYALNRNPIFFEVDKKVYPTVYTAWTHPGMAMTMVTHAPVFGKLSGGADLMLAGVNGIVTVSPAGSFEKDSPSLVAIGESRAAVAVGKTAVSSSDIESSGMRGKGVLVLHSYGDYLWAMGDKTELPMIPYIELGDSVDDVEQISGDVNSELVEPSTSIGNVTEDSNTEQVVNLEADTNEDMVERLCLEETENRTPTENAEEKGPIQEEEQVTEPDWKVDPDALLEYCFLQALLNAKKVELPVLVSSFTKQHLFPICPEGFSIDIKKSKHKKMSKFLQYMQSEGLIEVKEMSKGVDGVTAIRSDHEKLIEFRKSKYSKELRALLRKDDVVGQSSKDAKPEVIDMYAVSGKTAKFFKLLSVAKGTILSGSEVRSVITDYVKSNNLVIQGNSRCVSVDPHLADVVLVKGENSNTMPWDTLFNRFISQMNPCYEIRIPGSQPVMRKGKFEPIEVKVEKRMGNKKVTLVRGLEQFGIDSKQFAQALQHAAASSTAVNVLPGKGIQLTQVMVQGSQLKHVADVLGTFNIQMKYVVGLEKASKTKR